MPFNSVGFVAQGYPSQCLYRARYPGVPPVRKGLPILASDPVLACTPGQVGRAYSRI